MSGDMQLRERIGSFRDLVNKYEDQIRLALPKHIKPERIARMAITAAQRNPKLLECTQQSVILSLLQASECGLEPGTRGECYLVPFFNGKTKQLECQFISGYKGMIKLMRNSGVVGPVQCDVVRKGDFFEFEKGTNYTLRHKAKDGNQGEVTHAYFGFKINGEWQFEVMQRWELDEVRDNTKSKTREGVVFGPWADNEAEMQKKTVIRRGAKTAPQSAELERALAYEDDDAPADVRLKEMLNLGEAEVVTNSHGAGVAAALLEDSMDEPPDFTCDPPVETVKKPARAAKALATTKANPEPSLDEIDAIYTKWPLSQQAVFDQKYDALKADGVSQDDAMRQAYMAAK